MREPQIELKVRYGRWGEQEKTVVLPISHDLMRELMGKVELSNDPFSLMLVSPGLYGGVGNAVTFRDKTFRMRRRVARAIADVMMKRMGTGSLIYRVAYLARVKSERRSGGYRFRCGAERQHSASGGYALVCHGGSR